jgi:hypothetical protein
MKRKKTAQEQPIISKQIIEQARASVSNDVTAPKASARCVVCGEDVAPTSTEKLCWVCRRLKISAWHESDPMPIQE